MITVNKACIELIKSFEGLFLEAYMCPASVCTIGYGTISYPNGNKVKLGDKCTQNEALEYLMYEVKEKAKAVDALMRDDLTDNQFGALISFAYNCGTGALKDSTLRKRVNANPLDATIREAFLMWSKARVDGKLKTLKGLERRRIAEADLYFKN
jgi:lysozyme